MDIPLGSSKHVTRRSSRALATESSNSSGLRWAITLRTKLPTCEGVWNSAYEIARFSISKITDSGKPRLRAETVSRAIAFACAAEISPVASAEQVLGK